MSLKKSWQHLNFSMVNFSAIFFCFWFCFWVSSLCFAAGPSLFGAERTSVSLFYGQSRDVWGTLHDVKAAQGDLSSINEILQRKYGTYEEGMSTVKVRMDNIGGFESNKLLEKFWVEAGTEADAFGLVRNPVVPELHANAILAGYASVGFQGHLASTGIHSRLGLIGGSGYEKRIDAFSTDLIDKLPIRNGHMYYFGLSQDFATTFNPNDWKIKPRLSAHEIEFKTAVTPSSLDVVEGTSYFAFRWKGQLDVTHSILNQTQAGAVAVAGPQPIPVDILPNVWDYSHRMQSFPEFGAMMGAGFRLDQSWSKSGSWKNTAGFFGGYWGGASSLHLGSFHADVGTWGIEASSAYRTLGQRIWTASLGVGF